ncbi:nicotinate-nucleotide--dimethylbenzimidazole phosphoribosyltransferase [Paenibacillus antri]|uniref:Nicotinate-nucleotide--dimethylbenzimidazole phosphoribosyltransferase n=1 Tax=Paenibacillus antri TaxID=2582848 RepID=A0A5R9GBM1_9BACL|nr:nicotinate-nucleotide--dimethylbenzimidazole phosphoribosyltransferase [Paenibacillus antri]TLS51470.1 nicotinate-nucleotide--dimethylbenzimidazole phosphoribosyltransferase [Paenibacillus antri]
MDDKWLTRVCRSIEPLREEAMAAARERLDSLTKPPGSLGALERLAERLSGIAGAMPPPLGKKVVVVMAGDHGVCEEGVSAFPQAVTEQMVLNFLRGGAAVNVFAKHAGADVVCVDMGVAATIDHPGLVASKIAPGTANMTKGPAMTREQALSALSAGVELVGRLAGDGVRLIAVGEMGIGNSTAAAAVTSALLGVPPEASVGRGTGVDDAGLARKRDAVARALAANGLAAGAGASGPEGALETLAKVGGFELAGIAGVCLGAGVYRVPVVVDGYISTAAALVASRLSPHVASYLIASHRSEEPGHGVVLDALGLEPMLELGMRLGEGTGAALSLRIVEAAVDVLGSMATFASAGVSGKLE